jgi:hypothetical protein
MYFALSTSHGPLGKATIFYRHSPPTAKIILKNVLKFKNVEKLFSNDSIVTYKIQNMCFFDGQRKKNSSHCPCTAYNTDIDEK